LVRLSSVCFKDVIASVLRFPVALGWVLVEIVVDFVDLDVFDVAFAVNQKLFVV